MQSPDFSQMTANQIAQFFAARLGHIYVNRTAGDFTFTGVLFEFHWAMAHAKEV